MSTSITTTPEYTASEPSRPQDGDDAFFDGGVAPLWPIIQLALNRAHFARGAAWANLNWNGKLAVSGTAAAPVVVVGVIDSVTLADSSNVWRPYFTGSETTLGASHVEGGGSLSANTFYYVYAWSDAVASGSVKFQISATPPTSNGAPTVRLQYKRGETKNYRYLGCFVTNGSGDPLVMRSVHGRYLYRRSAISAADLRALTGGVATSFTDVPLTKYVPPHARFVNLELLVTNSDTALVRTGHVRTKGDTTNTTLLAAYPVAVGVLGGFSRMSTEIETDSARVIQYDVSDAATTTLTIDVLGFTE